MPLVLKILLISPNTSFSEQPDVTAFGDSFSQNLFSYLVAFAQSNN